MRRLALLFFLSHAGLIACGGSGATVPTVSSEIAEGRDGGAVAPSDPAQPVVPGTRFECKTTRPFYDGVVHTVRFLVRDGEIVEPVGDAPAFEVTPEGSALARLDEDFTTEHTGGKLVVRGGGKTELGLFDNSDLTKGYVKAGAEYAEIFCTKDR